MVHQLESGPIYKAGSGLTREDCRPEPVNCQQPEALRMTWYFCSRHGLSRLHFKALRFSHDYGMSLQPLTIT